MLYQNPFPSPWQGRVYTTSEYLVLAWMWPFNQMLSLFLSLTMTTKRKDAFNALFFFISILFLVPIYAILLLLTWPLALVGVGIRWHLSKIMLPYKYSFSDNGFRVNVNTTLWTDLTLKHFFRVALIDTKLLPESLSLGENLRNNQDRATRIAERIVYSQIHPNPQVFIRTPSDADAYTPLLNSEMTTSSIFLPPQNVSHLASYTEPEEVVTPSDEGDGDIIGTGQGDRCNEYTFQKVHCPVSRENSREPPSTSGGGQKNSLSVSQDGLIPDVIQRSHSPTPSTPESDVSYQNTALDHQRVYASASSTLSSHYTSHSMAFRQAASYVGSQVSIKEKTFTPQDHGVTTCFPPGLDFVCLTECFDFRATNKLVSILHESFSYVIYDVGYNSWRLNHLFMNSGLVFASRYPIVDAEFHNFHEEHKYDCYRSIGLLIVKVLVGKTEEGNPVVGYIAVTQLDSEQENDYRSIQMDSILKWLCRFQVNSQRPNNLNEIVAFDILSGTFNFDNMSPGDMCNWGHPLFLIYHDPCRLKPGMDKPWSIGTVLQSEKVNDLKSAESLKNILDQGHKGYMEDITTLHPDTVTMAKHQRCRGKRRVDLVLFSNELAHMKQECEDYAFVSHLAALTNHIPVCLTLSTAVGASCNPRGLPLGNTPVDETDNAKQKVMFETTV